MGKKKGKKKGKGGVGKESRWEEAVDAAHQAVASLSLQQAQEEHEELLQNAPPPVTPRPSAFSGKITLAT